MANIEHVDDDDDDDDKDDYDDDDDNDGVDRMWGIPFVIWQEGEAAAISIFEKLGRARVENSNVFQHFHFVTDDIIMTLLYFRIWEIGTRSCWKF